MAISAETEAILDRLKREGQLTRNSGTNSIRSVSIKLDKFENIFNSISVNVAEQTSMLRKSLNIQEEAIEAEKRKEDLDKINQKGQPPKKPTPKNEKKKDEKKKSKGLFDFLAAAGGGIMGMLKPLLIGGAGLFVAYNFAKGYIDEKTGGGFTKFENSMIDTFNNVDWTALGESFKTFASKIPEAVTSIANFLSDPLNAILAGAGLTAAGILSGFAGGALARGVSRGIIEGVLGTGASGGRDGARTGGKGLMNLRNVARGAGLGILTSALAYYSDDVKTWLGEQGMPQDWANVAVDSAVTIGTFTSVGMMFGPQGALVGAAIGLAYVLGKGIYNWFQNAKAEGERKLADRLAAADAINGQFPELESTPADPNQANTDGVAGTQSATPLIPSSTDATQMATAARIYEDFDENLAAAAAGNAEALATVREQLNQASLEEVMDMYGPLMASLTSQVNVLGDYLGEDSGGRFANMMGQLETLDAFVAQSGGDQRFVAMRNQMRQNMLRQFQGVTSSDENFSALTPAQQAVLRRLEEMMDPNYEAQSRSDFINGTVLRELEESGVMGTQGGQVVIGKLGGDNYVTNQTTRMGDQNVAQVTQVQGGGSGDSNPMSLPK
jgi:hypothetical protein